MNISGKSIAMIFGEIRERHTGKMPFGVASELRELMDGIEPERKMELERQLRSLETDTFWKDFIAMARSMNMK